MQNLIYEAIAKVSSMINTFQIKHFLPILLVGFLLLATNINPAFNNEGLSNKLDSEIHQDSELRPKTSGEFDQQVKETEGRPIERLKRIGEQSAEAVKDFTKLYPEAIERGATDSQTSNKLNR